MKFVYFSNSPMLLCDSQFSIGFLLTQSTCTSGAAGPTNNGTTTWAIIGATDRSTDWAR